MTASQARKRRLGPYPLPLGSALLFAAVSSVCAAETAQHDASATVHTSRASVGAGGDRVTIRVYCRRDAAGRREVAFGLPFGPATLTDASAIRLVDSAGHVVPVDAVPLARWRNAQQSGDAHFLRSVLLSFVHNCEPAATTSYQVVWSGLGDAKPALLGITPESVAERWSSKERASPLEHPETDHYAIDVSSPPVREPDVWVTLPPAWLLAGDIQGPAAPIRDPRIRAAMLGLGRTAVNDVNPRVTAYQQRDNGPGLIDWRHEVEGWLYDRPRTLWTVYLQTGDLKWLRHAHRASQYFASWIATDSSAAPYERGAFRKRPVDAAESTGDPKYSAAAGLFTAYLLTGDARLLDHIEAIAEFARRRIATRLPTADVRHGLWTERQVAAALSAALTGFEATGDLRHAQRAAEIVDGLHRDIVKPPSGYPSEMHGVALHRRELHENDGKPGWLMSPWMSALLSDALWQYHALTGDTVALEIIHAYAQFVATRGLGKAACGDRGGDSLAPRYLVSVDDDDAWPAGDPMHAFDVYGLLQRGLLAGTLLGRSTREIAPAAQALRNCALGVFGAPGPNAGGLPAPRTLAPTRKFNWWFGPAGSIAWFESAPHSAAERAGAPR